MHQRGGIDLICCRNGPLGGLVGGVAAYYLVRSLVVVVIVMLSTGYRGSKHPISVSACSPGTPSHLKIKSHHTQEGLEHIGYRVSDMLHEHIVYANISLPSTPHKSKRLPKKERQRKPSHKIPYHMQQSFTEDLWDLSALKNSWSNVNLLGDTRLLVLFWVMYHLLSVPIVQWHDIDRSSFLPFPFPRILYIVTKEDILSLLYTALLVTHKRVVPVLVFALPQNQSRASLPQTLSIFSCGQHSDAVSMGTSFLSSEMPPS